MRSQRVALSLALALGLAPGLAAANPVLSTMAPQLDPPTLTALGVFLPISGDDNFNAKVAVRFRKMGDPDWSDAMPLFRVHNELVAGMTVSPGFAGSVFDLRPGTTYEVELHSTDTDAGVDEIVTLTGTTRAVPADPASPNAVAVSSAAQLSAALAAAKPGDVITLANGTYAGPFTIQASGTTAQPIVVRGASQDGVILDGAGCACNVLEIYGSFVHVERLTIAHGDRGLRWQGAGADGNVLRRVRVTDVRQGNGTKDGQTNFYICDNIFEGRLAWPLTYADDGAAHASDEGIVATGSGHVVCHNRVSGFGDALNSDAVGAIANDYYGNDVLWTYDDGLELDGTLRNGRAFRNRFTNTYDTVSFQPIFGGPAYVFRNVIVNVANEALKLHALGGAPPEVPVGVVLTNNTFVRPYHAIQLSTPDAVHEYVFRNNLFIGPAAPKDGLTVMWDTPIDAKTGSLDYDGYFPDGMFEFGYGATGMKYPSFAAVMAGSMVEPHGTLVGAAVFASGLVAPSDHKAMLVPADATLAAGSLAVDHGTPIQQITDGFLGAAPDLGAIELGCAAPIYGPRPDGIDESNEVVGCAGASGAGGSGAGGSGAAGSGTGAAGNGTSGNGTAGAGTAGSSTGKGGSGVGGASAGNGGSTQAGGKAGAAQAGAAGNTTGAGGTGGATATPSAAPDGGSSGGCGCRISGGPTSAWTLGLLAALGLGARRKRASRRNRR